MKYFVSPLPFRSRRNDHFPPTLEPREAAVNQQLPRKRIEYVYRFSLPSVHPGSLDA
jgi:hypothetical protein